MSKVLSLNHSASSSKVRLICGCKKRYEEGGFIDELTNKYKYHFYFTISTGIIRKTNKDLNNYEPTIRPNVKYLVFQPGSTFKLTCEGKRSIGNITWQLPDFLIISQNNQTQKFTSTWGVSDTDKGIILATLTVSNATYADSGYYTCQNKDDTNIFSKQYIFIPGMIHFEI